MKKIKFLILALSTSLFALDAYSLKEVVKVQSDKPILLFIEADNCIYCEKAKKDLETDYMKTYLENFRFAKANMSKEQIQEHLKTTFTPTFYILDNNLEPKTILYGYQDKMSLIKELNKALYK